MNLTPYRGVSPTVAPTAYIAPTATLIGDVTIEDEASVWFGCVLRGDVAPIRIGKRTNIQDGTVIHGEENSPTIIGEDVTVGHSAIVHAAIVGDRVLVGMGSVLLSRCHIGDDTIIGARALVTEETHIEGGSLVLGIPAKVKRPLADEEHKRILHSALHYADLSKHYMSNE